MHERIDPPEPVRGRTNRPPDPPDGAVGVVVPEDGALRHQLLRGLARALAAGPIGAVAAFEGEPSELPSVLVRPGSVASGIALPVGGPPLVLSPAVLRRSRLPPARRVAELLPGPAGSSPAPLELVVPDLWPRAAAEPPVRYALQTYWVHGRDHRIWAARRLLVAAEERASVVSRFPGLAARAAQQWGGLLGRSVVYRVGSWRGARTWERLAPGRLPAASWTVPEPDRLGAMADALPGTARATAGSAPGHAIVLGSSGSGKTCLLADRAAAAVRTGAAVVAIDLHGDLAPAIAARLDPDERPRVIGIDVTRPPFPGVAALDPTADSDRAVGHAVAALKRLSPDGGEVYWGFRLERLLEAFLRLAHERGGSLRDAYALLTDEDLRASARLTTRSPDLARFLDDLGPIVRRNPEFLWGPIARLAKVVGSAALAALLAPTDGGLPAEELLEGGRSIVVRLPAAALGPEAASFAAGLVLGRLYFGVAARASARGGGPEVTLVLDELQAFSPRLVAEIYAEGRKFGWRLVGATQYAERLAPELRAAVAGDVREVIALRQSRPVAGRVGEWLGLAPEEVGHRLVELVPGQGVVVSPDRLDGDALLSGAPPSVTGDAAWSEIVERTRAVTAPPPAPADDAGRDELSEAILLAVLGAEESRRPLTPEGLVGAVAVAPGPGPDPAAIVDRLGSLVRDASVLVDDGRLRLAPAGERRLGLGAPTGAARESSEHRRLLLSTFRLFARRGCRLEIVRQGRFDVRLPDARFRQLPDRLRAERPDRLAAAIDAARPGWAWRYFGGRDVHVEAEVSGALRPERIRRGVAKARASGSLVLFVVGDGRRAGRIRSILRTERVGRETALVWTLPTPCGLAPPATGTHSTAGGEAATVAP